MRSHFFYYLVTYLSGICAIAKGRAAAQCRYGFLVNVQLSIYGYPVTKTVTYRIRCTLQVRFCNPATACQRQCCNKKAYEIQFK